MALLQETVTLRLAELQTELQTLSDNTEEAIISIGESVAKITVELRAAVTGLREEAIELRGILREHASSLMARVGQLESEVVELRSQNLAKQQRDFVLREHVAEIQRELAVYRAPSWIKPGAKIISHELGWAVNEPIEVVGEPYWQPGWGWLVRAESCDPDVLARMIAHGIGPRPTRCDLLAEGPPAVSPAVEVVGPNPTESPPAEFGWIKPNTECWARVDEAKRTVFISVVADGPIYRSKLGWRAECCFPGFGTIHPFCNELTPRLDANPPAVEVG
jgi:hypothetical protein